jgi:cell division protease FtsH
MLLMITLILVAMIVFAALELWLLWQLGERGDRRRIHERRGARSSVGDVTTGAESDLEQVTRIARQMVGRWGMSEAIGPMSGLPAPGQEQPLVPGAGEGLSQATGQLIESKARRIVEECSAQAIEELSENRERLGRLAAALLEHETRDAPDAYRQAGLERDGTPKPEPKVETAGLTAVGPSTVAEGASHAEA